MAEQSHNTYRKTTKDKDTEVVYNLIFKNALYSVESYRVGSFKHWDYCYLENITEDEGEAETFLLTLIKEKVSPIHMMDIAEDFF